MPFYWVNVVKRGLPRGPVTILDIGCGFGRPMAYLKSRRRGLYVIGMDGYRPCLAHCRDNGTHDEVVLSDARKIPIVEKSVDTVICLDVLECMEKSDGERLIRTCENLATKTVVIGTPVATGTSSPNSPNPFMKTTRSYWHVEEMRAKGFKVYGNRLPRAVGDTRWKSNGLPLLMALLDFFPFFFLFPKIAGHMVCIKAIEKGTPRQL